MIASLLAPQTIPGNELCRARLEQRKERQAYYYNRGASDLDPLQRRDTVRLKPFQLGRQEWQKGIVRGRLNERLYEVETPQRVARRSRVHLRKTNEPPPPSPDAEVLDEVLPAVPAEVDVPTPSGKSAESASSSVPEFFPTSAGSPPKPVLRRSERQRRVPKHLSDFVLFVWAFSPH